MSLIGLDTALVSLGTSCQSAWQLNDHVDFLADLLDEPVSRAGLPFDWVLLPPRSLISWLRSGEIFPASPSEIVVHPNFLWPRHQLHFWHEFMIDGQPAVEDSFAATREKFSHLFDNLNVIRSKRRRLFFMSNTQNNLDMIRDVTGLDFTFTGPDLEALVDTVNELYPGRNEFVFVTYADRMMSSARHGSYTLKVFDRDPSEVFGDNEQWRALFREMVPDRSRVAGQLEMKLGLATPALEGAPS